MAWRTKKFSRIDARRKMKHANRMKGDRSGKNTKKKPTGF
ncbi:Uncharacterised protein [uncultured archaeon]|nr:Uncharacterised protein [uncultured archaeon]